MSLTLGEKLRQAREERGYTISEVAEQTRISSLYLQSIENDEYNTLPGGIFNKGFVKSFAKFVGLNEQEALDDYGRLISKNDGGAEEDLKTFRPEVLTDDRSGASMAPTIIIAAIILALMTVGVLFLVDYIRQPAADLAANTQATNRNAVAETPPSETPKEENASNAPDMNSLKVEFTALSEPVALLVTTDGKTSSRTVEPGTSVAFEPKEKLSLSYSKSLASVVQLMINGRKIQLPAEPRVPRRNAIEFEINKQNLGRIWETSTISWDTVSVEQAAGGNETAPAANTAAPSQTAAPVTSPPPTSSPSRTDRRPPPTAANTSSNTAAAPRNSTMMRSTSTPRTAATPATTPERQ